MNKSLIGLIGSAVLIFIGIILRMNAHAMAWPISFSYTGSASDTTWGRQEVAIGQIGIALMFTGILIFVGTYYHWLFTTESDK